MKTKLLALAAIFASQPLFADIMDDAAEWGTIPPAVFYSDTDLDPDRPKGFDVYARVDDSYEFYNQVWRGNIGLAKYRKTVDGEVVRRGWYMIETNPKSGHIIWKKETDKDPQGRYAMELAQGGDVATTALALSGVVGNFVELNPIGAAPATVGKFALVQGLKRKGGRTCYESVGSVVSNGWMLTAANAATIITGVPAAAIAAGIAGHVIGKPSHNTKFWACAPRAES